MACKRWSVRLRYPPQIPLRRDFYFMPHSVNILYSAQKDRFYIDQSEDVNQRLEQHKQTTALLVMDMQLGIVPMLHGAEALIPHINKAIAKARKEKMPVIFVVVGFRQGAPEASLNNKSFGAGKAKYAAMNMTDFMQLHPNLNRQPDDIIVTKRRISAFTGSDLEVVLRAFNIQHVVLSGISTSGVMLSTTREAADKDYRITILSDCCADADEEVHRVLTTKIFPRQADVVTAEEWNNN
jgi:nicotinamidase-related amidase